MTEQVFKLDKAQGFLRKVSINVLHKNADYTLFTLPIEGIALSEEQLDAFMGQYTFRSWYEQKADGSWHPMTWWAKRDNGDFPLDGKFECDTAVLTIEGKAFAFEQYSADEEGEDEDGDEVRPGARITSIVLKPTPGGVTLLSFHLQVRPEIGKVTNALLEHQFRHIAVTFDQAQIAKGNGKQQSLPLAEQAGNSSPPPPETSVEVTEANAHPEPDATIDAGSHDGVQAPVTEKDPAEDLAKFEEGARQRAAEFQQRASGTIDGTTMRSRGGNRRRRGDAAH